jgi:competence protein ComEC
MSWQVDFWDVGQGDATSIRLPSGEFVLIDTGPDPKSNNPVVQWFCANPTTRPILAIAITHNDADHVGGLHTLAADVDLAIGTVYLVHDPKTKKPDTSFAALMNPLRKRSKAGRTKVLTLEVGRILAEDNELRLIARHPDFLNAFDAKTSNRASSILSLERKTDGKALIVWGGDALLKTIGALYNNGMPSILMGPHHGAPQDTPASSGEFAKRLRLVAPECLFISVGSNNIYDHPKRDFIVGASKEGIDICCSQITRKCLRVGQKHTPIFQGSGRLGLPAPAGSVPCRGTMRVFVSQSGVTYDQFQSEYRLAVDRVHRPLCKRCKRP